MTEAGDTGMWSRAMQSLRSFSSRLTRKKFIDADVMETNLRRCLNTADITLLAIGHMIGSGVYVLTATVAKNTAGPAIVVAFLFSGFASFLAALCYAELGVRYPRSGSAYSYTYLALGELWAFMVGWNVALEHVIGAAAISRACSAYIDSLAGGVIKNGTEAAVGTIHIPYIAERLDFLAFGILILFVVFLSFGVKMTSYLNNVFSAANMVVILTIVVVGAYFSDTANWTNPDIGGFMPFGWSGVLAASASCFYAYVGFDSIAASGEEARDPQKSIPRATMISMGIATITYVSVATVLTLMVKYTDITEDSGLPDALESHGAHWAKIVVILGAVSGMSTGIIGSLFALTRVVYVMADDGLLFGFCSGVHSKSQVPLTAMYIFSSIAALMALTLDITTLVEVMSIGTLFAYLVVSASVIILRYRPSITEKIDSQELSSIGDVDNYIAEDNAGQFRDQFLFARVWFPWAPQRVVCGCVVSFVVSSFATCGFLVGCTGYIERGVWWAAGLLAVLVLWTLASLGVIVMLKQSTAPLSYKVPLVPLIPALSIIVNALLIVNLKAATWLRLLVWVAIGLAMYFSYGVYHSKLDAPSSKSNLLKSPGSDPLPTWGSMVHEPPSFETKKTKEGHAPFKSSVSKEFLVPNLDAVSP